MTSTMSDSENNTTPAKKVMIVVRRAPHGTIYVHEALEVMLIVAAYNIEISAVFIDDGVYALKKGQDTSELGSKPFMSTFRTLIDWEVENVYIDSGALEARGIDKNQLTEIGVDDDTDELIMPKTLNAKEIYDLMQQQDSILSF